MKIDSTILKEVAKFTSKEVGILGNILFDNSGENTVIVATDSAAIITYSLPEKESGDSFMISSEIIDRLPKNMVVDISEYEGEIYIACGNYKLCFKPSEGNYPRWREVIPKNTVERSSCPNFDKKILKKFQSIPPHITGSHPIIKASDEEGKKPFAVFYKDRAIFGAIMSLREYSKDIDLTIPKF